MQKRRTTLFRFGIIAVLTVGGITTANATLIDRGNGMVYDTDQNLTWLQDANYAQSSGDDADGIMTWVEAVAWADNLVYEGYSDWRLPAMVDTGTLGCNYSYNGTDCGYNVATTTSELAYLYEIILTNTPYLDTSGNPAPGWNFTPNNSADGVTFDNLQSDDYWLGIEYAPDTADAWYFSTREGLQFSYPKSYELYAWAVRSGDVPEPGVLLLLSFGVLGMIGARWRFRQPLPAAIQSP